MAGFNFLKMLLIALVLKDINILLLSEMAALFEFSTYGMLYFIGVNLACMSRQIDTISLLKRDGPRIWT